MNLKTWTAVAGGLALTACATTTPPELVDARAAYTRAAYGPTARLASNELNEAAKALSRANAEFEQHPKSKDVDDYAYIAKRKVERAESKARLELAQQRRSQLKAQLEQARAEASRRQQTLAQGQATAAQQRLDEQRARLAQTEQQLQQREAEIAEERAAREQAENQAREVAARLEKIASVRREPRGVVVTLSGSLLFASGRSDLLPQARLKLDEVAQALQQAPSQSVVIEGHTDAVGEDAYNLHLANLRADTVRQYLISRGLDAQRISSIGLGESRPVASNSTPEGRANNRRVEIVLNRSPADMGTGGSGPGQKGEKQ
jgi:outer membrane protein OmpA-like peptidoglycan-associated protein